MPTTLISLIGKGRLDPKTGYRTARYHYPDGQVRETPFFGMGLNDCIRPDKLILVGTRGSMWDVFFEHQKAGGDESILALINAVHTESVTQDMLTAPEQQLSARFGIPVQCLLIPYAENESEQAQILLELAGAVQPGEHIILDVTHGFRHLPMLALVAARYLKYVGRVQIQDVYYGALEMTGGNGETPVLNLGGMLRMLDWVEALAVYEHSGDYGIFKELFEADGMPADRTAMLGRAAYFERSSNPVQARQNLTGAFKHIQQHSGALGRLFSAPLAENVAWFEGESRAEWEISLADLYLARHDYLRAIIFMLEGFISLSVLRKRFSDVNDYDQREAARHEERFRSDDFQLLTKLRNAMAHGSLPSKSKNEIIKTARRLLLNEEVLELELKKLRERIFSSIKASHD